MSNGRELHEKGWNFLAKLKRKFAVFVPFFVSHLGYKALVKLVNNFALHASYQIIYVNQNATRSLNSHCLLSLRISLGKYIAWRKAKKAEVPRSGNKFENNLSAKRFCQDMYGIVRFLHKSLITEQSSIKDKMKPSKEYFYSGFWNLNQTTGDWFV